MSSRPTVTLNKEHHAILKVMAEARRISMASLVEGFLDATFEGMQITGPEDITPAGGGPDQEDYLK